MIQSEEYYFINRHKLLPLERRTYNRKYLHPKNQRLCSVCCEVKDDIAKLFNVKKYYENTVGWDGRCKECQSQQNLGYRLELRKDYRGYINSSVSGYKARAKELSIPFNIDAEYLIELFDRQQAQCHYTGQPLCFERINPKRNSPHLLLPSLDRLDPAKGYVKDNVVWCLYYINRMKNDLSQDQFIQTCRIILNQRS